MKTTAGQEDDSRTGKDNRKGRGQQYRKTTAVQEDDRRTGRRHLVCGVGHTYLNKVGVIVPSYFHQVRFEYLIKPL